MSGRAGPYVRGPADRGRDALGTRIEPDAVVTVADSDGLIHRLDLGPIPNSGIRETLAADLADSSGARPAYPLEVIAVEIESQYPDQAGREVILECAEETLEWHQAYSPSLYAEMTAMADAAGAVPVASPATYAVWVCMSAMSSAVVPTSSAPM